MDTSTLVLLVILAFALLAFASFYFYKQRTKIGIKGPMGARFDLEASNDPTPAVHIKNAKSRRGGLTAADRTGRGAAVKDVTVEKDINVVSSREEPPSPKA